MADPVYDAVIVGAGLSGAMVAKQLALAGKRVLILESGAEIPANLNAFMETFDMAFFKTPESPYTPPFITPQNHLIDPSSVNAGRPTVLSLDASSWKDPSKSYLVQKGPLPFASTYERIGGGTARHWLGTALRFLPNDFSTQRLYGQMVDWPIGYDDLSPWYAAAETEIGVSADVADQTYLNLKFANGYAYPLNPIPLSLVDQAVADGIKNLEIENTALSVRSTPAARNSQPYQNRPQCAGNTNCIPICPIQAKYDPTWTLNDATATGKVDVLYQTVASEIIVDANGRVAEINYLQYQDPQGARTGHGSARGKIFVLAAHAIETPRLMLMSKNNGRTPDGVGNSHSKHLVGKNLMDHPLYLAWALAPQPVFGYRGPLSTAGIEELRDGEFRKRRSAFRIEIGNEGWNFPIADPDTTTIDFVNGLNLGGLNGTSPPAALFGSTLMTALNDRLTRQLRLAFLIEQMPEERNRVSLAAQKDKLGLQRPAIDYDLSQYTRDGLVAAKSAADQIFAKMRAQQFTSVRDDDPSSFVAPLDGQPTRIKYFGSGHILGTVRMGANKEESVVNADLRCWDHPNLFVVGSSTFPTAGTANPSLTLAALALRAADAMLKSDLKN